MQESKNYIVYKHTAPNGKVYIGITGCRISKRWNNGRGYCKNKHFAEEINVYGWENIKHETIYCGLTKEEAQDIEVNLIRIYKSTDRRYGYNLTRGGECADWSDDSKERMSQKKKKQMQDPEIRARVIASQQYRDKSYCKTKSYRESRSACMKANWADPITREAMMNRKATKTKKNSRKVLCLETGVVYETITLAAKSVGDGCSNLARCCRIKYATAKGFHWRYIEDKDVLTPEHNKQESHSKPVRCVDTGEEYRTIKEAAYANGVTSTAISNCLRGVVATSAGRRWVYG